MMLMTLRKSVVTVDCTVAPRAGKKVLVWLCTATVSVCVLDCRGKGKKWKGKC